ncbi:OLC1v1027309C1 [Oldenlandia corymbosa var. corymbosa]|uniref:OLC1v1027309C1 n=1 Tax=Oldenlandia corymbosa var. corymbosa TaxID=529605 RepID=A0AAV1C9V8_OLDCO|nr:OLC1v1027309C1 [Oldenlandia corymbosa var. corymbosa]
MSDSREDSKLQHLSSPTPPPDDPGQIHQDPTQQTPPPPPGAPPPAFLSSAPTLFNIPNTGFDQPPFEAASSKRPRYTAAQWKQLSPSTSKPHQQHQNNKTPTNILMITESSPTSQPPPPQPQTRIVPAASSSDTASSPSHSPRPSHSVASTHQQFRKGKYVSPVWKPNEMLWLARAWRVQYQGGVGSEGEGPGTVTPSRGKTRADKDREVAEFLNRHGVERDAKTAGTKWDNMLGEFRKVYEWEKGGEKDQVGKSYFRLSPYERKLHRLPASFDEEVFEELSQFMGSRMRTPQSRVVSPIVSAAAGGEDVRPIVPSAKSLLPPPFYRDEDLPISARGKQIVMTSSTGGDPFGCGSRGGGSLLGFESSLDVLGGASSGSVFSREVRRIGKVRMIWEESVSLWGEEGDPHRGRVKLQGCSFLNADEVAFLDDSMVACTMEAFEDGPLKGFSVDRFLPGQQVKVFGRRKSLSVSVPAPPPTGPGDKPQHHSAEPSSSLRSNPTWEFQDPTDYYLGCLRAPPSTLPSLFELSWHIQEPPPEEFRFPLRRDVYKDLPQGKELFFTTCCELLLDCRGITYDIISPILKQNPSLSGATATTRDSFIGMWDDCINRIVSKFCCTEMVIVRKNSSPMAETIQDEWPHVCGFSRNFCLWRGEETDQLREGHVDPSSSIVEKLLWTYTDLPYILGYYAVGYIVTFCAISRSQDRIIRTDLYTVDLSNPTERLKALVPCWRIAGILPLLADQCVTSSNNNKQPLPYSDFERIDLGGCNILEMTPNTTTKFFSSKRRWAAVKEIYDFLDQRIPHAEFMVQSSEKDLGIGFKPRGCRVKPTNCDQLIEALKQVTKALAGLHDLCFMHRDLSWEKIVKRCDRENEWLVTGFEEATGAPQIDPHDGGAAASGRNAPEMGRGLHSVKVDVWGVGQLIKSSGLVSVPKMLRELQNRCLDHNPEQRPTAADCYHHLLQLQQQSSMSTAAVTAAGGVY